MGGSQWKNNCAAKWKNCWLLTVMRKSFWKHRWKCRLTRPFLQVLGWDPMKSRLLSAQVVGSTSSLYHVVGTGDFDGNGANDILFRHDDGEVVVWLLDSAGQLLTAPQSVGTAGNQFHIDGTGDLNGDGRSDIIFRDVGGNVIEWLMNGATAQTIQVVGGASQDFAIAAHHFDLI